MTEKFFDPLLVGSVPVYLGAPNIADFAPGENCYIDASRFDSARALASHLKAIAADEPAYAGYLRWKSEPLRTSFLAMTEELHRPAFSRLARRIRQLHAATHTDPAAPARDI